MKLGLLGAGLFLGCVGVARAESPLLPPKLEVGERWKGVRFDGPVLTLTRVERFAPANSCEAWFKAFKPTEPLLSSSVSADLFFKAWQPLDSEDQEDIESCVKNPCSVKLSDAEVGKLQGPASSGAVRLQNYFSLITARVLDYQRSALRKGYEFVGEPVDPWAKVIRDLNLSMKAPSGKVSSFEVRSLDFAPGKIRVIRQVLDSRVTVDRAKGLALFWRRDLYTNHYFDSWGEWTQLECTPGKKIMLSQALVLEFDLLKKTDFFSSLMQGGMKSTLEEHGARYLEQGLGKLVPVQGVKPTALGAHSLTEHH